MAKTGFRKILVAFDGSQDAVKAVRMASSIAREYGAALTILHVYSVPVYTYAAPAPMPQVDVGPVEESAKEKASKVLEGGVKVAGEEGVTATGELLEAASVVQAVVEFAAKESFNLIVMGTRGMTGFRKLVLGSVSNGVVSHAHCPVMVVR
jgi:nucleotide-binding universal stress UspA family protein